MERTYDLVVVGGGIAGLTAALRAQELGLRALVLEQGGHERYPCNSRFSGGIFHLAFHDVKRAPHELVAAIASATGNEADEAQARAVVAAAPRLVDWLQAQGARFMRFGPLDWHRWCLAPARPVTPGLDWEGRGPDVTLRRMTERLLALGGELRLGTEARSLVMRDGACRGVVAADATGEREFHTPHVVLADGGFQSNRALFEREIGPSFSRVFQRCAGTGRGAGLRMALEAGAAQAMRNSFYGHVLSRDAFTNARVWPYPEVDAIAAAGVVVDGAARRVLDEGLGGIAIANQLARTDAPDACFAVFDTAIWNGPGTSARLPANPLLERAEATLLRAPTIAALAEAMGVPPASLQATVDAYNAAVTSGSLQTLTPPRSQAKAQAMLVAVPPYMALPICAGITYTMGGIRIDSSAQVLSRSGEPMPGLYAAGTTTGGLEGGGPGGYVGGLAKSGALGLIAAESIAAQCSRPSR